MSSSSTSSPSIIELRSINNNHHHLNDENLNPNSDCSVLISNGPDSSMILATNVSGSLSSATLLANPSDRTSINMANLNEMNININKISLTSTVNDDDYGAHKCPNNDNNKSLSLSSICLEGHEYHPSQWAERAHCVQLASSPDRPLSRSGDVHSPSLSLSSPIRSSPILFSPPPPSSMIVRSTSFHSSDVSVTNNKSNKHNNNQNNIYTTPKKHLKRGRPRNEDISNLILSGSSSRSNIKCHVCHRVFPREKSLQAHLRTHSGDKPYKCNYSGCGRAFAQSGQLRTHQRLHTGEKPFVCQEKDCDNRFTHPNRRCSKHPNAGVRRIIPVQPVKKHQRQPQAMKNNTPAPLHRQDKPILNKQPKDDVANDENAVQKQEQQSNHEQQNPKLNGATSTICTRSTNTVATTTVECRTTTPSTSSLSSSSMANDNNVTTIHAIKSSNNQANHHNDSTSVANAPEPIMVAASALPTITTNSAIASVKLAPLMPKQTSNHQLPVARKSVINHVGRAARKLDAELSAVASVVHGVDNNVVVTTQHQQANNGSNTPIIKPLTVVGNEDQENRFKFHNFDHQQTTTINQNNPELLGALALMELAGVFNKNNNQQNQTNKMTINGQGNGQPSTPIQPLVQTSSIGYCYKPTRRILQSLNWNH